MSRRVVIEIGRRELRAVDAIRQGDTLRVRRTLAADLPTTVDTRDAGALGAWVGDQLRSASDIKDTIGGLSVFIEFPVPCRVLVWRVKYRFFKEVFCQIGLPNIPCQAHTLY